MTKTNLSKIKIFDHKDSISQTQASKQFNCHQTYICKTLQRHTEIKLRKKQKIPERTEEQKVKITERCGILNSKYRDLSWLRYLEFIKNVPEIRPIENFWSILKGMVYKNNWRAKTLHQLRLRISKCLRELD